VQQTNCRKIGLYGGTFDPVHSGHLSIAQQILVEYGLDELIFIPASRPPHKSQPFASFDHRVAMLEKALPLNSKFSISLVEAERTAPSYTIHTLHQLRSRLASDELFLIIGADSFCELHLWYRYKDLLSIVDLVVAARPSFSLSRFFEAIANLPGHYEYDEKQRVWREYGGRRIYYFAGSEELASSTEIRQKLSSGQLVRDLLPSSVFEYIRQHGLYIDPPLVNFRPDR